MDNETKRKIKIGIIIAAFTVLLYLGLQHMDVVLKITGSVLRLLSPFLYGVCFAFVLNIPMRFFEQKVFARLNARGRPLWRKLRRPVCVTITLILFLGIVAAIVSFILPQLTASVRMLADNFNGYVQNLTRWTDQLFSRFGISIDESFIDTVSGIFSRFGDAIVQFVTDSVPQIVGTAVGITSSMVNLFLGFIMGIYMLATKESLIRSARRIIYAYLPRSAADYTAHVYRVVNRRFAGFVAGQLTEASILGMLCFLGMNIFGWGEYALLISIIIGLTNIVPIIGPIIGTIPGALIILVSASPMQAVFFVIYIIALQQIESNLIYPRVMGDSIGLPGLWVMFAVLVGGGLLGLPGVLLGVPTFAVLYTLLSESVGKRLKMKEMRD